MSVKRDSASMCLRHSLHMTSQHKTAAPRSVQKLHCGANGECGAGAFFFFNLHQQDTSSQL